MAFRIITSSYKMQAAAEKFRGGHKIIGLVPTMGAIHEGHLKLVEMARKRADIVVASIFVNPIQFGPREDFSKYPRPFRSDCNKLRSAGVDIVFHPSVSEMYPENFSAYIEIGNIGEILEGASRPGHFKGVATVCAKLFNIVKPHFAVFGQKDGQQLAVIRHMIRDFNFNLDIITGTIIRTEKGVALSSRHKFLSKSDLEKAEIIHQSLELARSLVMKGMRSTDLIERQMRLLIGSAGAEVEYISFNRWDDLFPLKRLSGEFMISLVVKIAGVRLLDNIIIKT